MKKLNELSGREAALYAANLGGGALMAVELASARFKVLPPAFVMVVFAGGELQVATSSPAAEAVKALREAADRLERKEGVTR